MDREELTQAIERPVARAGLKIEPRLVEALVAEVGEEPGGLPLLSTTLLELWQGREDHNLRLEHYRATGGVRGAVARIAEAAYTRMSQGEQTVARNLFLRLVDFGEGAPERRRVRLVEIEQIEGADRVLAALTDARLLTVGAGVVELSHEAVVREWPRYSNWLEEGSVGRRLHEHLRLAAVEWNTGGRDPGELYRGARLAAALDFASQHWDELDRVERAFITASHVESDRETRRQRSQNRRLRVLLAGAAVLLVLAVVAGVMAVVGQRQASVDARLAIAESHAALGRQLGAEALNESRLDVAALMAREAVALDPSPLTEGSLLTILMRSPAVIGTMWLPADAAPQVAVSPDGRTLAVSDTAGGQVRLYAAATNAPRGPALSDFHGDQPPAYSPDGSLLVYPNGTSLVVRDAQTLALRDMLAIAPPFSEQLTADIPDGSVVITPGGRIVSYAYWLVNSSGQPTGAYLARWSLPSGRALPNVSLGRGPLLAVRLIDGGTALKVVTARRIATYSVRTAQLIRAVAIRPVPLLPTAAAISPDGNTVVMGSGTGSVWFVTALTGAASRGGRGDGSAVASVVYAPSGNTVTTEADDGTVGVWDPGTETETAMLGGPAARVRDAAISPSGSTLYTAAVGGVVLAWDLTGTRTFGHADRLGQARQCCEPITPPTPALALSPDGSQFAMLVGPSTVGVFSTNTLERETSFSIPAGNPITALAWSPTGTTLAVGAHNGIVQLWGADGRPRLESSLVAWQTSPQESGAIQALAFSPNGSLLAATDKTLPPVMGRMVALPFATLATWVVATGRLLGPPTYLGQGTSAGSDAVAFSDHGGLLAATLLDGGVRTFDPSTGQALRTLNPRDSAISLAFAPNGTLAAGTLAGTVLMWNPATGRSLGSPLLADVSPIAALAFDSSGQRFATAGFEDGSVKVWSDANFQQEGPRLATDSGATSAVAFEPSGGNLLAVDDYGRAFTWPVSPRTWERRACSLAGTGLIHAAPVQLVGGARYKSLCS